jgi:hypothetical protein
MSTNNINLYVAVSPVLIKDCCHLACVCVCVCVCKPAHSKVWAHCLLWTRFHTSGCDQRIVRPLKQWNFQNCTHIKIWACTCWTPMEWLFSRSHALRRCGGYRAFFAGTGEVSFLHLNGLSVVQYLLRPGSFVTLHRQRILLIIRRNQCLIYIGVEYWMSSLHLPVRQM